MCGCTSVHCLFRTTAYGDRDRVGVRCRAENSQVQSVSVTHARVSLEIFPLIHIWCHPVSVCFLSQQWLHFVFLNTVCLVEIGAIQRRHRGCYCVCAVEVWKWSEMFLPSLLPALHHGTFALSWAFLNFPPFSKPCSSVCAVALKCQVPLNIYSSLWLSQL